MWVLPPLFSLLLLGLGEGEGRCEELAFGEWVCHLDLFPFCDGMGASVDSLYELYELLSKSPVGAL